MSTPGLTILFFLILIGHLSYAQVDSAMGSIEHIPNKYIQKVDLKIDKYRNRLTEKSEKTLTKLSGWETKIQKLLQKANPDAAERLFGYGQPTFTSMLRKLQEGKQIVTDKKARFNEYRDRLSTTVKYVSAVKSEVDSSSAMEARQTVQKMDSLESIIANTEALTTFIKQRKKQLTDVALQHIGKSKYLTKINKESYYYVETLKNYKELFSDPSKAEKAATELLTKVPAFTKFMEKNSALASLFHKPVDYTSAESLNGLQTRSGVDALIQSQLSAGGPNAMSAFTAGMQQAQGQLSKTKDNLLKAGGGNSNDVNLPDFKPNHQKTKTLLQRLEFGTNFQFAKNSGGVPGTVDLGLSAGYKLNDKSVVGLGMSYKMGIGRIERISISHQGIGLRSFLEWKLKRQVFVSGGYELNYNNVFQKINQLQNISNWQQSGLIGLSKKINSQSKLAKATKISLLYDFLYKSHIPQSQPVLYRIGYDL